MSSYPDEVSVQEYAAVREPQECIDLLHRDLANTGNRIPKERMKALHLAVAHLYQRYVYLGIRQPPHKTEEILIWLGEVKEAIRKGMGKSPEPPAAPDRASKGSSTRREDPTPAETRAWQSYVWVREAFPELIPEDGERHYTKEMHREAMGSPAYIDEGTGRRIANPNYGSWTRNLRGYMAKAPQRDAPPYDLRQEEIATEDTVDDISRLTSDLPSED